MSGIRPSMLRACMYSGVQFVTYETVRDKILGIDYSQKLTKEKENTADQ